MARPAVWDVDHGRDGARIAGDKVEFATLAAGE